MSPLGGDLKHLLLNSGPDPFFTLFNFYLQFIVEMLEASLVIWNDAVTSEKKELKKNFFLIKRESEKGLMFMDK